MNGSRVVNGAGGVNGQQRGGEAPPPPTRAPGESPWAASGSAGGGGGEGTSPWAAVRRPQQERVTGRLRRVVEGLPDWEPLPPGETLVRRPGSTL
ncbi:hypothetical protein [Streptomyces sp. YIM S03343]